MKKVSTIKKKTIHIAVEESLKNQAEALFSDLGMSMNTAITIFLKQALAEQAIPFSMKRKNLQTIQALEEVQQGNLYGGLSTASELMESLDE